MKLLSIIIGVCILFGLSLNSLITVHYGYNYDYIVTELCIEKDVKNSCCKGSCHLIQEFTKADQSRSDGDFSTVNTMELMNWFKSVKVSSASTHKVESTKEESFFRNSLSAGVLSTLEHPPCFNA